MLITLYWTLLSWSQCVNKYSSDDYTSTSVVNMTTYMSEVLFNKVTTTKQIFALTRVLIYTMHKLVTCASDQSHGSTPRCIVDCLAPPSSPHVAICISNKMYTEIYAEICTAYNSKKLVVMDSNRGEAIVWA